MGRIREEERMIYNFYAEFANAEEFTKINRSAEWKDICGWCLENGIRINCFPVAIDDKIQAFFFCEVKNGTPSEQEALERLKMVVPNIHSTSQEIPVAIDWGRIIDGCSHSSKSKDREKGTKVIKPASLVGLGDYELKTTFSEE